MQNLFQIACSACLVVATAATAQTPSSQPSAGGTPDKMPFDTPYGTTISLDTAKRLLAIAEAEAKKHDWKMNMLSSTRMANSSRSNEWTGRSSRR
jgi:hypothetical protein